MARHSWVASAGDASPRHPARLPVLFRNTRYAPLWLLPRVALGWVWLDAGWRQLGDLPAPVGHLATGAGGPATLGFAAIVLTLAGIALILGALTGLSAVVGWVFGAVFFSGMNLPVAALQGLVVVGLMLAWQNAGWIGLDRWLLPLLGLSGRGGVLIRGVGRKPLD